MEQVVSFPGIGISEFTINRVAFHLFGMPIYWYGVIIAAGMLAAILYVHKRARAFGLDIDRVYDVVIGAVAGGVVGARLYYVIFTWEQYRGNLMDILKVRDGGLAIYGGVIGGFVVGYLMCQWRKVRFLPMADLAVGGVILAQGIGRWGNFVNVEAFGSNTTLPWGMASPSITQYLALHQAELAAQGVTVDPFMPVHPTFFYESVWCILGFIVIMLYTGRRRFDGELTLIYGAWYGMGRAVIEGLRTDSLMLGNIRVSQALAILLVVICLGALFYIHTRIKKSGDPDFLRLYVKTDEAQAILEGRFYGKKNAGDKDGTQEPLGENIGQADADLPVRDPYSEECLPAEEKPQDKERNGSAQPETGAADTKSP